MEKQMKTTVCAVVVLGTLVLAIWGCVGLFSRGGDDERVVRSIADWLKKNGEEVSVSATNGVTTLKTRVNDFPAQFCGYDMELFVEHSNRIVRCECLIPSSLDFQDYDEQRRRDFCEFLFRAECEYGLSPATLALTKYGDIRCRSWLPFDELLHDSDAANKRLIGSVVEKCHVLCALFLTAQPPTPDDARKVVPQGLFDGMCRGDRVSIEEDARAVLENCFGDGGASRNEDVGSWVRRRFGGEREAAFIDVGTPRSKESGMAQVDERRSTLVVRSGMVWNVCRLSAEIPEKRLNDVAYEVMRINECNDILHFGMDFDSRAVWCQYGLPVGALRGTDGRTGETNLYRDLIKTAAPEGCARYAQMIGDAVDGASADSRNSY